MTRKHLRRCVWPALLTAMADSSGAASAVELLGFVTSLCADETYCFELRVEPRFADRVGNTIRVGFADVRLIFDPENYLLTLEQQDIVTGYHLRLLLVPDSAGRSGEYEAEIIWIGD